MNIFTELKDSAISFAKEKIINIKFKRYGEMLDFNINSENKLINAKVTLKGESEPLTITIFNYKILENNNSSFIGFDKISTSKEWMNLLAEDFLKEKKFPLPSKFSGLIKMIL